MRSPANHTADMAPRVLTRATLRASKRLGLSKAQLAGVLGVSPSTITRMAQESSELAPDSMPGERALLLIRLFRSLDSMVGDANAAAIWMATENTALAGAPRDVITTAQGLVNATAYLDVYRARP